MKKYFASYFFEDKRGNTGFGRTDVFSNKPFRSMEDIKSTEEAIKKTIGYKQVAILHWCPFEIEVL